MCGTRISTSGCIEHRRDPRKDHEDIATTYAFYLHVDLQAAEQAISLVAPPKTKPGRYRAPDPLLRFLEGL